MKISGMLVMSVVMALVLTGADPQEHRAEAAQKPNIVFVMMDDFSPLATWLWCQPSRTPALARFCSKGVHFKNAIGETPVCCPARAQILTGRHGHRNGVTQNEMSRFDPSTTIASKFKRNGYRTAYIGKYLNKLADEVKSRRGMLRYAQGWDTFNVTWHNQGRFFGWRQWTREGTNNFGRGAKDHSSLVAAQQTVRFIKQAPRKKPVFAFVSLYDGHKPYTPMKRFDNHRKCKNVKGWQGPAFNEKDVSDKPNYIQNTPRLGRKSAKLQSRCESVMTVNHVMKRIRSALKETGRLDDTLLIFTADNGWMMGDHRLTGKNHAYTTPVPLYMLWPSKWGDQKRVINEPVSNIDYARTFGKLAGFKMPKSDGRSLLPLMNGTETCLGRKFIYEELLHGGPYYNGWNKGRPGWYGLRTTSCYSDTRWVYTEYQKGKRKKGDRELYNLTEDPHQLNNLAGKAAYVDVQAELRQLLHDKVITPNNVKYRKRMPVPGR